MKKRYKPQPIDTSDVKLPVELEELVEEMSRNVHEVWADSRIKVLNRYEYVQQGIYAGEDFGVEGERDSAFVCQRS